MQVARLASTAVSIVLLALSFARPMLARILFSILFCWAAFTNAYTAGIHSRIFQSAYPAFCIADRICTMLRCYFYIVHRSAYETGHDRGDHLPLGHCTTWNRFRISKFRYHGSGGFYSFAKRKGPSEYPAGMEAKIYI